MDSTIIDRSMFEGYETRILTIKMGNNDRPHNMSIVVHLENPGGSDSSELLPPVFRGIQWQCRIDGTDYNFVSKYYCMTL